MKLFLSSPRRAGAGTPKGSSSGREWTIFLGTLGFFFLQHVLTAAATPAAPSTSAPMRMALTPNITADASEGEMRSAIRAWAKSVFAEQGLEAVTEPEILSPSRLRRGFEGGTVDFAVMTSEEFIAMESGIPFSDLFVPLQSSEMGEEYLLLVHRESAFQSVRELEGHHLGVFNHASMVVATTWLDVVLAREKLPVAEEFFGRIDRKPKAASIVLPVFFRSAEACLVNRRAFETMVELNPQLGKKLRVLATSPRLVPGIFVFSASFTTPTKDRLVKALRELHQSASGLQVLTLFQTSRLQECQNSAVQPVRDLLTERRRLRQTLATEKPAPSRTATTETTGEANR